MNTTETLQMPEQFADSYTPQDQELVAYVIQWAVRENKSPRYLERISQVKKGLLLRILKGEYPSPPGKHLLKLRRAIEALEASDTPLVPTSLYTQVTHLCQRCQREGAMGAVTANNGIGKTTALQRYADGEKVIYIRNNRHLSAGALLDLLVYESGAIVRPARQARSGNNFDRYRALVRHLKGGNWLIILDEAEQTCPNVLDDLRGLNDEAGVGILLAGDRRLDREIKRDEKLVSRIKLMPAYVDKLSLIDAEALIQRTFRNLDLEDDIVRHLWDLAKGSTRQLANRLLPAIQEYVLGQGRALTRPIIDQLTREVLAQ
jgi:DNA transposition AAA+ family ATPase